MTDKIAIPLKMVRGNRWKKCASTISLILADLALVG